MIIASVLASAAVVLTGPAAAPATLQGDLDAAAAYWQAAPVRCSTQSVFVGRTPPHTMGEATLPGAAGSEPCEMKISRGLSPRLRCLVVVHEYGHWLGHYHSRDRHDPMFPRMDPQMVLPQCEHP
jgi:hypothetical protein